MIDARMSASLTAVSLLFEHARRRLNLSHGRSATRDKIGHLDPRRTSGPT